MKKAKDNYHKSLKLSFSPGIEEQTWIERPLSIISNISLQDSGHEYIGGYNFFLNYLGY